MAQNQPSSSTSSTSSLPTIAIVGAGPGGLTLARILQTRNIPFTVYERDASPEARAQGGSLDLHQGTGLLALESAGLTAAFQRYARNEGQDMRIMGPDAVVRLDEVHDDPTYAERPEIDRADLRQILLESIEPGRVKWGCALSAVKPVPGTTTSSAQQHVLEFKDGSAVTADLVVGADGAWSRVRPLVSSCKPAYAGMTFIELHLTEVSKRHPEVAALVGRGMLMALGNNRGLIAQTNSRDNIRVYAVLRGSESWAAEHATVKKDMTPAEEQAVVLQHFEGWHESLTGMITRADPGFITRPLFALPETHAWTHVPGVTLLGDAAHLMVPNGEGVNLAMVDAMELGLALAEHPTDVDAAVKKYEAAMFTRAHATAAQKDMDQFISENGPEGVLAFFASHGLPAPEQ